MIRHYQKVTGYGDSERRKKIIAKMSKIIEEEMKNYVEPERKGIAKGEPIGFSSKKTSAAWWMTLHPYCLTLKEIAKLAGVSEGVLRVWCHRKDFILKWQELSHNYGEKEATKIKGAIFEQLIKALKTMPKTEYDWSQRQTDKGILLLRSQLSPKIRKRLQSEGKPVFEIDDRPGRWSEGYAAGEIDEIHDFMECLPWFNEEVRTPITDMLEEYQHIPQFLFVQYTLAETRYYWEDISPYRMRMREIKSLPRTKALFKTTIDMLTDPCGREKMGEETYREMATSLIDAINTTLDILSK